MERDRRLEKLVCRKFRDTKHLIDKNFDTVDVTNY